MIFYLLVGVSVCCLGLIICLFSERADNSCLRERLMKLREKQEGLLCKDDMKDAYFAKLVQLNRELLELENGYRSTIYGYPQVFNITIFKTLMGFYLGRPLNGDLMRTIYHVREDQLLQEEREKQAQLLQHVEEKVGIKGDNNA